MPETTSFGNAAAASASRGISASHGPRSTISACAPCSSSGGEARAARGRSRRPRGTCGGTRQGRRRGRRVELLSLCGEGGDRRVAESDPRGRRLDDRQGAETLGSRTMLRAARRHPRTSARRGGRRTPGVSATRRSVVLEVDPVDRRVRRKAWAFDEDELERVGERALRSPRPSAADDAPVHEHDPLHRAIVACCNEVGPISFSKATFVVSQGR